MNFKNIWPLIWKPSLLNKVYQKYNLGFYQHISGVKPKNGNPREVTWSFSPLKYRMSERLRLDHLRETKFLLRLRRQELRLSVIVVMGHCTLKNHMKTMRLANSLTCVKCLEEVDTLEHFLCICPIFSRVRHRTEASNLQKDFCAAQTGFRI